MKRRPNGRQRPREAAALLPVIGLFLLMPPVITLFSADAAVAGVPLVVIYLFGVWLALIAVALWLAPRIAPPDEPGDSER